MAGPANAVMGDQDEPTAIPQSVVPEEILVEERKMAKYSKTKEFQRLKEFMEARIEFYRFYLPDGSKVQGDPKTGNPLTVITHPADVPDWIAACIIINEFQNILNEYDNAAEVVSASEQG